MSGNAGLVVVLLLLQGSKARLGSLLVPDHLGGVLTGQSPGLCLHRHVLLAEVTGVNLLGVQGYGVITSVAVVVRGGTGLGIGLGLGRLRRRVGPGLASVAVMAARENAPFPVRIAHRDRGVVGVGVPVHLLRVQGIDDRVHGNE